MAVKLSLAVTYTIRIAWIRSVLNQPPRKKWHLFCIGVFLFLAKAGLSAAQGTIINVKGIITHSSNMNHECKRKSNDQMMLQWSVHKTNSEYMWLAKTHMSCRKLSQPIPTVDSGSLGPTEAGALAEGLSLDTTSLLSLPLTCHVQNSTVDS